jgi:dTDP-4-dehydrorhamnose 3,5-epimerase
MEIEMNALQDERGFLIRIFDEQIFTDANLPHHWVQENHSMNRQKNIVRGLHFLLPPHSDGKLIRCIRGEIYDVAVDLRTGSPTFGKWVAYIMNEDDGRWLYYPKGFAHGYCTLSTRSEIIYKHDSYYRKEADSGIRWNDTDLNITWPCKNPMVSAKDSHLQTLEEFIGKTGGL